MSETCEPIEFEMPPAVFPLQEGLVLRAGVATFASYGVAGFPPDAATDATWLRSLHALTCSYGAATHTVHPLLVPIPRGNPFLTAKEVLAAMQVRKFQSEHTLVLGSAHIDFPGYNAYTDNDEIHNDAEEQHIFKKSGPDEDDDILADDVDFQRVVAQSREVHRSLIARVVGRKLWYLLLHGKDLQGEFVRDEVLLIAVGKSPNGNRAIGVVTHQTCHNLCD